MHTYTYTYTYMCVCIPITYYYILYYMLLTHFYSISINKILFHIYEAYEKMRNICF